MRLSMWILADWLADFSPRLKIQEGKRTLRNARLYDDGLRAERSTVYVGYAADFFDCAPAEVICANGHDLILLEGGNPGEILNRILDAFDYYNGWSDQLREMVQTDCTLSDVLVCSAPTLKQIIMVADASYYVFAKAGLDTLPSDDPELVSVLRENMMSLDAILAINQDGRIRLNNPHTYILEIPGTPLRCAVRNIFFRNQHKGWVICVKHPSLYTRGEADLQDELGDIVEQWLENHQNQRELLEQSGIFTQILEGKVERADEVYRRVEALGWGRHDALAVFVFRNEAEYDALHYSLDHKLEQLGAGLSLHFEGNLLFVLNTSLSEMPAFSQAFNKLLERVDAVCGESPLFTDIFDLPAHYELAVIAANFGSAGTGRVKTIESAALPYYFSLIAKNDHAGLLHPALRTLGTYDARHHTELCRTLETYIRCDRNYIKAAEVLHLHRNSLLYRISRITALTGIDLNAYESRLYLMMSFEIEKVGDVPSIRTL